MTLRIRLFENRQAVFNLKTLAFLVISYFFMAVNAQAQVPDTVYQKPSLNNGMPPAQGEVPVIIREPQPQVTPVEPKKEEKTEEKKYIDKVPFKDRFFTGGGFGLSFGDYTNINVAPILGFRLNDRFAVGTGLTYFYVNDPFFEGSLLGGKMFAQAMVYKNFFAHGEYELVDFRSTFNVVLAGAGYRQMISDRVGFDMMLLFDLKVNGISFYQNPVIRPSLFINL